MDTSTEKQTITLVSFLTRIFENRRLIARNVLIYTVVGLIIALILPFWYTSTAVMLPPEARGSSGLNIVSMVTDLPFDISGAFGIGNAMTNIYIGILNSRNVREAVIKKLNLIAIWEKVYMEDALRQLDAQTLIDITEEGLMVISTTAKTRDRAKAMCQAFLDELDRVNKETRLTNARYTREFIEKRYKEADRDLHTAAEAMRDFQKENGVFSIEDQVVAAIEAAADIRAQFATSEVEYEVLRKRLSPSHDNIKLIEHRLEALRNQLDRIEFGDKTSNGNVLIPFSEIPELGLQYIFLYRDVEVQKAIYQLLAKQYEQARIQETKDTPTVELLDVPSMPERKSKPKRAFIVLAASFLSFFVSGFTISLNGYMDRVRAKDSDGFNRFDAAYQALRHDIGRLVRFKRS